MSEYSSKTERLPIDSFERPEKTEKLDLSFESETERLDISEADRDEHEVFTGSLKSGESIDGYTVEKLLSAHTGEAEIFLAEKDKKKAIIKYYHGTFKPVEEILQKLHHLDHPDVIDLYEYGSYNGRFYEIMEYAAGGTLGDKNPDGSPKYLPMEEGKVIEILKEVFASLQYIHGEGIIHRDIKPGNLFYRKKDGSDVMIGDFGISSQLDVADGKSKRMTAKIALSDGYAAPELYGIASDEGQAKILIGPEVDYYALGMTIFEMLTGISPFKGKNPLHIMRDTIEGKVAEQILDLSEAKKFDSRIKTLLRGLLTVRHDKRWGEDQVDRWLRGKKVEVFKPEEETNSTREEKPTSTAESGASDQPTPPLKFGKETITSVRQLVRAMDTDRDMARKYLMRGMLEDWARKFDASLTNDILDARELKGSDEQKVLFLLFKLDPALPFRVGEQILSNREDIQNLIETDPSVYEKMIQATFFHDWLAFRFPAYLERIQEYSDRLVALKADSPSLQNIPDYSVYFGFSDGNIKLGTIEIDSPSALNNIPAKFHKNIITDLKKPESLLYQWMLHQNVPNFMEAWNALEPTWENLLEIIKGNIVRSSKAWTTGKQIAAEKENEFVKKCLTFHKERKEKADEIEKYMQGIDVLIAQQKKEALEAKWNFQNTVYFAYLTTLSLISIPFLVYAGFVDAIPAGPFPYRYSALAASALFFITGRLLDVNRFVRTGVETSSFITTFMFYAFSIFGLTLVFDALFLSWKFWTLFILLLAGQVYLARKKTLLVYTYTELKTLQYRKEKYRGPESFESIMSKALRMYFPAASRTVFEWDFPEKEYGFVSEVQDRIICGFTNKAENKHLLFTGSELIWIRNDRISDRLSYAEITSAESLPGTEIDSASDRDATPDPFAIQINNLKKELPVGESRMVLQLIRLFRLLLKIK